MSVSDPQVTQDKAKLLKVLAGACSAPSTPVMRPAKLSKDQGGGFLPLEIALPPLLPHLC